jgi:hypothetical protein
MGGRTRLALRNAQDTVGDQLQHAHERPEEQRHPDQPGEFVEKILQISKILISQALEEFPGAGNDQKVHHGCKDTGRRNA